MEKFRVSNVEIFRRAFGDSHYLFAKEENSSKNAKRGRKGSLSKENCQNDLVVDTSLADTGRGKDYHRLKGSSSIGISVFPIIDQVS
mgnify:CR=1 FL=1